MNAATCERLTMSVIVSDTLVPIRCVILYYSHLCEWSLAEQMSQSWWELISRRQRGGLCNRLTLIRSAAVLPSLVEVNGKFQKTVLDKTC